jgi:hypothetical protein
MTNLIFLVLFIFFIQFGMGGGLYEVLVIYHRWKKDVTPENLAQKLQDSGQAAATRRFWPIISPPLSLLSIINIVLAWQYTGLARTSWLTAALIIFIDRIITFAYFVPTMMRKFEHPEKMEAKQLRKAVLVWTFLSPIRLLFELSAWSLALWALIRLVSNS